MSSHEDGNVLRLYGKSSVKIHFRTKTVFLLHNKIIAPKNNAFSVTVKKLVKTKNASDIRH